MKEDKALRLWAEISGIDDVFLDELDANIAMIAAKAKKIRRGVKYGAIVTAAASISAAVAIMVLRPKLAGGLLSKAS